MTKNRLIQKSISKFVLAGLLVSTLPVNLPLAAQARKSIQFEELKTEINQKVRDIERVVVNLKRAKIIIPSVIAVAGAAALALAISVAVAALIYRKKYLSQKKILSQSFLEEVKMVEKLEGIRLNILKSFTKLKNELAAATKKVTMLFGKGGEHLKALNLKTQAKKRLDVFEPIAGKALLEIEDNKEVLLKKLLGEKLLGVGKKAKTAGDVAFLSIVTAIVTAIAAPLTTLAAFKVLSKASIARAARGVIQLEQIEKSFPGILTTEQKGIVARFKKLYKDPTARGIIQGLRLKDALITTVNAAMKQPFLLVTAFGGPKKARKLFSTYIKLKWKEELFEKALREGASFIKSVIVKLQLKSTKKKLKKFEARYPQLKSSLKNAVQTYQMQANGILQELKEDLIKAAEKKELKPEMRLQPVSPMPVVPL